MRSPQTNDCSEARGTRACVESTAPTRLRIELKLGSGPSKPAGPAALAPTLPAAAGVLPPPLPKLRWLPPYVEVPAPAAAEAVASAKATSITLGGAARAAAAEREVSPARNAADRLRA